MFGSPGTSSVSHVKTDIAHQLLPLHAFPCLPALALHTAYIPSTRRSLGSRYDLVPTNNFMHGRCMILMCDPSLLRCCMPPTALRLLERAPSMPFRSSQPRLPSRLLCSSYCTHPQRLQTPWHPSFSSILSPFDLRHLFVTRRTIPAPHPSKPRRALIQPCVLAQHAFRTPTTIASACLLSEPAIDIPWSFLPSRSLHSLPDSPAAYRFHLGK